MRHPVRPLPLSLFALLALSAPFPPGTVPAAAQATVAADLPDSARLVTEDIARFWAVYDRATDETLAELLRRDYIDAGSPGVRDFIPARIVSAEALAEKIMEERERYEAARERSLRILELERAIRAPLFALEELYPPAVHPDVYFVIGRFNSGGTASRRGLLIGAEMLPDPERLPTLVAHELVHFQQPRIPSGRWSLLARTIREGSADFIAELVSGWPPGDAYMRYGLAHEAELWEEFREVMHGDDLAGWMYGGQPEGRPADLGYFIGYRIAEAYYQRAADKRRAVRDILTVTDYEAFLEASAYDPPARASGTADPAALAARVDALFAEWDRLDGPGAAVAVLKDGRIVLERGYGSAQLEHRVPITPSTVFHVASVTKQLIAFGVALLAERGRLSLDDDVRAHLPEVPDLGATVTLRHLIHHTSGVRDQWELLAMAGWRLDDVITREHVLGLMERQRELNFPPGSEYLYSNMGYTLLAEVISRAGGQPFPEWMEENVFRPLGMASTHLHVDHEHLVPGRAYSYVPAGRDGGAEGWEKAVLSYAVAGATSLFTTAGDLARWLRNFETAEVGGPGPIRRMHERGVLTGGDTISYAFAIARGEHRGRETWGHSGGDAGFRSHVIRFPEARLGVVLLSNAGSFNPSVMARRVADVYLGEETAVEQAPDAEAEDEATPEVRVPARLLEAYAGRYDVEGIGVIRVERRGERLVVRAGGPPLDLVARADALFHSPGAEAWFRFVREDGRVARIVVHTASGELSGTRLEEVDLGPAELSAYAGAYYSPELETLYRIEVEGDGLVARHKRHGDLPLVSTGPDAFAGPRWFFRKVEFTRDAGRVDGFRLTGGRVRNLRFVRLAGGALP